MTIGFLFVYYFLTFLFVFMTKIWKYFMSYFIFRIFTQRKLHVLKEVGYFCFGFYLDKKKQIPVQSCFFELNTGGNYQFNKETNI